MLQSNKLTKELEKPKGLKVLDSKIQDGFKFVCNLNDLTEYKGSRFIVENTEIALFKVKDNIFALSNICPHQHTTLIYDGIIEDGCVVCPVHGWTFDLKTGKQKSGARGLDTFLVKIENEDVFIKVEPKKYRW